MSKNDAVRTAVETVIRVPPSQLRKLAHLIDGDALAGTVTDLLVNELPAGTWHVVLELRRRE